MKLACKVTVNDAIRYDCVVDDTLPVQRNDWCILRGETAEDCGRITHLAELADDADTTGWAQVTRPATLLDQSRANEQRSRSQTMQRTATELIANRRLPMRVIATHLTFDRNLVILIFTAPGRVDFRELLKDLNRAFHARVELRQIGPRDQAAIAGGLGSCGRTLCCTAFLTNFVSINVKMVKAQGMTLNPSSVIGACGRLKCCLDFEYESYRDLLRTLPRVGAACKCQGCDGRILERHPLTGLLKVALSDERVVTVPAGEVACAVDDAGGDGTHSGDATHGGDASHSSAFTEDGVAH